jgi:hypothetical protein
MRRMSFGKLGIVIIRPYRRGRPDGSSDAKPQRSC